MGKSGGKLNKTILSAVFAFLLVMSSAVTSHAYTSSTKVLPTDVTTPSSGCVLIGVKGDYITEAQQALNRINAIRLEACKEGVWDPRDSSKTRKLTEKDYVPIKWSSGLETIARIRAAEASLTISHTRPTGENCWSISANGVSNSGEVLAWNWSSSMMSGIEQWYDEKGDWVNNGSGQTGHYEIMINPNNTYVGLGCMVTDYYLYPNTTCGRFSASSTALDTSMASAVKDCIQLVEIKKSALSGASLAKISGNSVSSLKVGDTVSYELVVKTNLESRTSKALLMDNVTWKSSNTKIAMVDAYGSVTGVGEGTVTITATSNSGFTGSVSLTFTCHHDETEKRNIKKPTCTENGYSGDECCKVCGKKIASGSSIKATGHQWDKGKVTQKATAKKAGKILYTCKVCKKTKTGTIPATGNSTGKVSVSKVKSLKAKAGSKKLTITWKKVSGAAGYQLQVSTKSSFKGAKTIQVSKSKKQYVAKKLKAKKKYYVRIRAYKTYKDAKGKTKKAYGTWVKVSKKTKK